MKKLSLLAAVVLTSTLLALPAHAAVKAGATCSKVGITSIAAGKKFTCVKSGKKAVWNKGLAVSTSPVIEKATNPEPVGPKAGDVCTPSKTSIKVSEGRLYCVKQSDGSSKYIQFFDEEPGVNNPASPEDIRACQPPDLRGGIAEGSFRWAITYPAGPVTVPSSGTLNIAVVPIDFSDVPGTVTPSTIFADEIAKTAKWFKEFSNGKLNVTVQSSDKWIRASKTTDYYDVGEGKNFNDAGISANEIMQDLVNVSQSTFSDADNQVLLFVYPPNTSKIKFSFAEMTSLKIHSTSKKIYTMTWADANRQWGPAWNWTVHEILHQMGLGMHFPVNPPSWGIEWGGFTHTPVLYPWNQAILDWINPDQYYCASISNLKKVNLTLKPLENPGTGLHGAFIRLSNNEALVVTSHRYGAWSTDLPESFYGTMVAVIDTTKQTSWSGENTGEDKMDGGVFPKSGVYLHPQRTWETPKIWTRTETGDWGALMYLGDSVTFKGVTVKVVKSDNFDTVEIAKG